MRKKTLIISIILFLIPINVFAIYYTKNNVKVSGRIAEPIIAFEPINQYEKTKFYKDSIKEYRFKIKNYIDSSNTRRINEVNLSYSLEFIYDTNFPIKLELYDSKGNELLQGRNITSQINIEKNVENEEEYKLIICWEKKENMSANTDISIKVNTSQIEEVEKK